MASYSLCSAIGWGCGTQFAFILSHYAFTSSDFLQSRTATEVAKLPKLPGSTPHFARVPRPCRLRLGVASGCLRHQAPRLTLPARRHQSRSSIVIPLSIATQLGASISASHPPPVRPRLRPRCKRASGFAQVRSGRGTAHVKAKLVRGQHAPVPGDDPFRRRLHGLLNPLADASSYGWQLAASCFLAFFA